MARQFARAWRTTLARASVLLNPSAMPDPQVHRKACTDINRRARHVTGSRAHKRERQSL
jgi:hypothetical protein